MVPFLALRGFSPGTPVFPSPQKPIFPNSNSIWNCKGLYHEPLARVIAQALPVFDIKFEFTILFLAFTYGGRVSSAPVSRELGADNGYKGRNVEFINDIDLPLVSTTFIFEKQAYK